MQKKRSNEELCVAAQSGDETATAQLVKSNLPYIRKRAREIWNDQPATNSALGVTIEDLIQVGCEELLRSFPDFDTHRGALFLTYAGKRIKNKMIDYLKQQKMLLQFSPTDRDADVEDYVGGTMVNGHKISTNPAILYVQKETIREFLQAFSTLTKREQEFFYYWQGMDRMDIARSRNEMIRRHGISEAEAKRLQRQSAEKLWKQLGPLWSRIPYFVESTMEDE